jgi:hypothetical protein
VAAPIALTIQDPVAGGRTLLDAIADAAQGADRGGGIFAFATERGIATLLADPAVESLCKQAEFQLTVGIDSITDKRALEALLRWEGKRPGLQSRVFVHDLPWIFHPKLCWFARGSELIVVVGSGNLTQWGLGRNFEAFLSTALDGAEALAAEKEITDWLQRHEGQLLRPDATKALERAERNSGSERSFRKRMQREEEPEGEAPPPSPETDALVLEISRNAPGRMQLDIGLEQFRHFFGGEEGKARRIQIQHVESDGALAAPEPPRALIFTSSRNYRFEASANRDRDYPTEGRPIGVFVRVPGGIFRYRLLWPGDDGHAELDGFLAERAAVSRVDAMRRVMATLGELAGAWPDSPFLETPSS